MHPFKTYTDIINGEKTNRILVGTTFPTCGLEKCHKAWDKVSGSLAAVIYPLATGMHIHPDDIPTICVEPVRSCAHCGKMGNPREKQFKRCSGCKSIVYCSTQCQRLNWRLHRAWCQAVSSGNGVWKGSESQGGAELEKVMEMLELD